MLHTSRLTISLRTAVLCAVGSIACFISILLYIFSSPLHIRNDCALYLDFAQQMLNGAIPYVNFTDVNPPLIFYLSLAPALFSAASGWNIIVCFHLLIVCLVVYCWSTSTFLLINYGRSRLETILMLATVLVLNVNVSFGDDFGQREHIFLLLYLPYMFLRCQRWRFGLPSDNKLLRILVGTAAGVGIAIKPQFALPALAFELAFAIELRRAKTLYSAENFAVLLALTIYAVHFLLLPAAEQSSLVRLVKLISQAYPYFNGHSIYGCLLTLKKVSIPLLFLTPLCVVGQMRSTLLLPLWCFTVTGFCGYVYQRQGLSYQGMIPWFGVCLLLAAVISLVLPRFLRAMHRNDSLSGRERRACVNVSLCFLAISLSSLYLSASHFADCKVRNDLYSDATPECTAIRRTIPRGEKVSVLAHGSHAYPAVLQNELVVAQRDCELFEIPFADIMVKKAKQNRERQEWVAIKQQAVARFKQDLKTNKPRWLLSYRFCTLDGLPLEAFLRTDPELAVELDKYKCIQEINGCWIGLRQ